MPVKSVKTKCLECKKKVNARAKVDSKGNVTKYIEIYGGIRKSSPLGYIATYCLRCANITTISLDLHPAQIDAPQPAVRRFFKGERVKYLWGVGQLWTDSSDDRAHVYFVNVGLKKVALMENGVVYDNLIRVSEEEANQPLLDFLDMLEQSKQRYCRERDRYNLYVIKLNSSVLNEYKFLVRNNESDRTKPCLYIGITGKSPEERYQNHIDGHRAANYVRKYHDAESGLLKDFFDCLNPMPRETAVKMEKEFAEAFKKQGFPVWWN